MPRGKFFFRPDPLMTHETPVRPRHSPELRLFKVEPEKTQDFQIGVEINVGDDGHDWIRRRNVGQGIMSLDGDAI